MRDGFCAVLGTSVSADCSSSSLGAVIISENSSSKSVDSEEPLPAPSKSAREEFGPVVSANGTSPDFASSFFVVNGSDKVVASLLSEACFSSATPASLFQKFCSSSNDEYSYDDALSLPSPSMPFPFGLLELTPALVVAAADSSHCLLRRSSRNSRSSIPLADCSSLLRSAIRSTRSLRGALRCR